MPRTKTTMSHGHCAGAKLGGIGWAAIVAVAIVAGCRWPQGSEAPKPLAQRLTWCGHQADRVSDSVPSDTLSPGACVRIQRLDFPGSEVPLRMELRQYRTPIWAFTAWEGLSRQSLNREGCIHVGKRWAFVHGAYLGLTDSSAGGLYSEEFRDRLASLGEPAFILPQEFEAFPLLGRIPGSERIITHDFLGGSWSGQVFSVAYPCHGDTALAFRTGVQNPDSLSKWMRFWKGENALGNSEAEGSFKGVDEFGRPIFVGSYSEGIFGVAGCFDPELGREYAEKMLKMKEFWHDP